VAFLLFLKIIDIGTITKEAILASRAWSVRETVKVAREGLNPSLM